MINLVSVVMPVRNGLPFVIEAVDSILVQTYNNIELVIVDDGSTDGTGDYVDSLSDVRVKVVRTGGVGLVAALNLGFAYCTGEYVARMDADDISLPNRLMRQVNYLRNNPLCGVVCTDAIRIDEDGREIGYEVGSINSIGDLVNGLCYVSDIKPIIHPSVMIRRTVLPMEDVVYRNFYCAEDRDLWLRLSDCSDIHRIQEKLLKYRITQNGISRSKRLNQAASSLQCVLNFMFRKKTGIDLYVMYPRLLSEYVKKFEYELSGLILAECAFEQLKILIRNKCYASAIVFFAKNYIMHWPLFTRSQRLRFHRKLVEREVSLLAEIFANGGASIVERAIVER